MLFTWTTGLCYQMSSYQQSIFVCFHCFSVVGAVIIAIGFYTVLWAQSKEENAKGLQVDRLSSPSAQASPLLEFHESNVLA